MISDSDFGAEEAGERCEGVMDARYGIDQSKGPINEHQANRDRVRQDLDLPPKSTAGKDDHLTPEQVPDVYASVARGSCLEPVYKDGDCIVFDKTQRPGPGDFVGVWFVPGFTPPGEPDRWVKRLVSCGPPGNDFFDVAKECDVQPIVVVEMLNPPKRFAIPASSILAIHMVVGLAVRDGSGRTAWRPAKAGLVPTAEDRAENAMIEKQLKEAGRGWN